MLSLSALHRVFRIAARVASADYVIGCSLDLANDILRLSSDEDRSGSVAATTFKRDTGMPNAMYSKRQIRKREYVPRAVLR